MRTALVTATALLLAAASVGTEPRPPCADVQRLETLQASVVRVPEDLHAAAAFRQLAIACSAYDRSTRLFEQLTKRGGGPNVHISLALAYVDKVPVSGDIKRLYLGRDAIGALTIAITRQPSVLAYYIRGLINLYYNNLIFHRARIGVADLRRALELTTAETPPALAERVLIALGDGYWRADDHPAARRTWADGAARFPSSEPLKKRLTADDGLARYLVGTALDESVRVDTSLRNMIPD